MLGWWAVSAAAKYIARGSMFEAAMAIDAARGHALGLAALAQDVPDPQHGLVSILDHAGGRLPDGLPATYGRPDHVDEVHRAAVGVAELLAAAVQAVAQALRRSTWTRRGRRWRRPDSRTRSEAERRGRRR